MELPDLWAPVVELWTNRYQTQASRRLRLHAELREALKDIPAAQQELDELLAAEAAEFAKREHWLLQRKFSGNRFGWGIMFSIATLFAVAFGCGWILQSWGTPWVFPVALGVGALIGLPFGMAMTLFRMVYSAPEAAEQAPATDTQPPA